MNNVIIVTAQVHTPLQYDLAEIVHANDGALIGTEIGLNEIVTSPGNKLEHFISKHFVYVLSFILHIVQLIHCTKLIIF